MKLYALDFETLCIDENQTDTWVWSSAGAELKGSDLNDVFIHHSIDETYNYLCSLRDNVKGYYHNLKFDGAFWLDFLLKQEKLTQAHTEDGWLSNKDMPNNSFKYLISDMGQWYSITIKTSIGKIIEFVDSLKLIPFSLSQAGKAFDVEHQKLSMEYTGYRDKDYVFTDDEKQYILNDVLCLKECLEYMFSQGHTKSTIGSCCMSEYQKNFMSPFEKREFKMLFPNLYDYDLPYYIQSEFTNVGEYIRKSYRGGWCYLKEEKANTVFEHGITNDVNSLYPSVMHSMSGNRYPVGEPTFWSGNYIPEVALQDDKYFFVRFKCRFYLKEKHLPTVQIKNNPLYKGTEYLHTSDVYVNGVPQLYIEKDSEIIPTSVIMTMTMTDYYLFLEQYNVKNFEILDGCFFQAITGIFDSYINYYGEIKKNNKGALRSLAKLFLNNLYGQFAKSNDSSYKYAYLQDNQIKFVTIPEFEKTPGYIPIGSAITSYARDFTIRVAQQNYDNFIYADTDSIHMTNGDSAVGFVYHDVDFCCWKKEMEWDKAIFARQKTYIELNSDEFDIKCAGMTQQCKQIFKDGLCLGDYKLTDFKVGLEIPFGKLRPKRINGGIILVDSSYVMR